MKKSALGIHTGIESALIFIAALINPVAFVVLIMWIALKETDKDVKLSAKKAIILFVLYFAIDAGLSLFTAFPELFTDNLGLWGVIIAYFDAIVAIVYKSILLILACLSLFSALMVKETKICPKCGADINQNAQFCNMCGEQMKG